METTKTLAQQAWDDLREFAGIIGATQCFLITPSDAVIVMPGHYGMRGELRFDVQIWTCVDPYRGYCYSGNGRFCADGEAVRSYISNIRNELDF